MKDSPCEINGEEQQYRKISNLQFLGIKDNNYNKQRKRETHS